jgi:hypothetical protein
MHQDAVKEVHGYIAFYLHAEAEQNGGTGAIHEDSLRFILRDYLERQERDASVNELFAGVQRVVAIVQNKNGLFEFEVQPLREYFAGKYLYDSSPYALAGSSKAGQKHERLYALMRRPYWENVLRFFAGCFSIGELAGLVDLIRESTQNLDFSISLSARKLTWTLIGDRLFTDRPTAERRAVGFAFDKLGTRVVSAMGIGEDLDVGFATGADDIIARALYSTLDFPICTPLTSIPFGRSFGLSRIANKWLSMTLAENDPIVQSQWLDVMVNLGIQRHLPVGELQHVRDLAVETGNQVACYALGAHNVSSAESVDYLRSALNLAIPNLEGGIGQSPARVIPTIFNLNRLIDYRRQILRRRVACGIRHSPRSSPRMIRSLPYGKSFSTN